MKQRFILSHDTARQRAIAAVTSAPEGMVVEIKPPTRSLEQNALLWPLLTELAQQIEWYGQKLTTAEWKDIMTAGLKKQRAVPGIDGGFVVIGAHTSKMSKAEFSDLVELIFSFGAEHGVKWPERVQV